MAEWPHNRFEALVKKEKSGCWIWNGAIGSGYPRFMIGSRTNNTQRSVSAIAWAYRFFNGPIENGKVVTQDCGNRLCVNPDHLVCVTRSWIAHRNHERGVYSEATRFPIHTQNNGRFTRYRNPALKITDEQVQSIIDRHAAGELPKNLALAFGISESHVHFITRYKKRSNSEKNKKVLDSENFVS